MSHSMPVPLTRHYGKKLAGFRLCSNFKFYEHARGCAILVRGEGGESMIITSQKTTTG